VFSVAETVPIVTPPVPTNDEPSSDKVTASAAA